MSNDIVYVRYIQGITLYAKKENRLLTTLGHDSSVKLRSPAADASYTIEVAFFVSLFLEWRNFLTRS